MASLQSAAPAPTSPARAYDPEINDIADYVHNKPIDSELAVSCQDPRFSGCRR
jgi:2-methylcitrate dehydratase